MADTVFTMGPSNVTSLLATTLSKYGKSLGDNIHKAWKQAVKKEIS